MAAAGEKPTNNNQVGAAMWIWENTHRSLLNSRSPDLSPLIRYDEQKPNERRSILHRRTEQ